jgi:VIT family
MGDAARSLLRPAVFGAADGLTCALGAILSLAGHPELVLRTAVALAAAECVGMAAGEWLSQSSSGFQASAVIGLATGVGGALPALPYAWFAGGTAAWLSVAVFAVCAGLIAWARAGERGWLRAAAETYGVLAVVAVAVAASQLAMPSSGH